MRDLRRQRLAIIVALAFAQIFCASFQSNAYKAADSLAVSVEAARQAYVALYDQGKITPQVKARVELAYSNYQRAALLFEAAMVRYRADKNAPPAQAAVDALAAAGAAFLAMINTTP